MSPTVKIFQENKAWKIKSDPVHSGVWIAWLSKFDTEQKAMDYVAQINKKLKETWNSELVF